MADLSDVTAFLAGLATSAVYPNGTSNPSIIGKPIEVHEGWPLPGALDAHLAASPPVAHVSVFPVNGSAANSTQVFEEPSLLVPAVHGCSATVSTNTVTLAGAPGTKEYVSIIADGRHAYSRTGGSLAAILSALLTDIKADYPLASLSGSTLTIPGSANLVCRIGANATMGRLISRQISKIMVTVWAPNHPDRSALAAAIDVVMKQNLRITLPDSSQAIMTYDRTNTDDSEQTRNIYRRDLIYGVEYGTIETFDAYEVTSVSVTDDNGTQTTTVS